MRQKHKINTNIEKIIKIKMINTLQTSTNIDSKNCYLVWHIQTIIKILKNITNIVELAVKVTKKQLQEVTQLKIKIKMIEIKLVLFRDFGC